MIFRVETKDGRVISHVFTLQDRATHTGKVFASHAEAAAFMEEVRFMPRYAGLEFILKIYGAIN